MSDRKDLQKTAVEVGIPEQSEVDEWVDMTVKAAEEEGVDDLDAERKNVEAFIAWWRLRNAEKPDVFILSSPIPGSGTLSFVLTDAFYEDWRKGDVDVEFVLDLLAQHRSNEEFMLDE